MVWVLRRTPPGSRLSIRSLPTNTSSAPTLTFNPVTGGWVPLSDSLTMMSSSLPTSVPAGFSTGLRSSCVIMTRRFSCMCLCLSPFPSWPVSLISIPYPRFVRLIIPRALDRLACFRDQPHEQSERGHVLSPPPSEGHAGGEAGQRDGGQVRAARGLGDVRAQRGALQHAVDAMLGPRQRRHRNDCQCGDGETE